MGHADRSRLHYAFSLDAQSRRIRLSLWPALASNSDTNPDRNSYGYTDSYSDVDSCKGHTHAEAASYASAAAVAISSN